MKNKQIQNLSDLTQKDIDIIERMIICEFPIPDIARVLEINVKVIEEIRDNMED